MKGYYVIPSEGDMIDVAGRGAKLKALAIAKKIYLKGDSEVFIQHYDDDNYDGFSAGEEYIFIKNLII